MTHFVTLITLKLLHWNLLNIYRVMYVHVMYRCMYTYSSVQSLLCCWGRHEEWFSRDLFQSSLWEAIVSSSYVDQCRYTYRNQYFFVETAQHSLWVTGQVIHNKERHNTSSRQWQLINHRNMQDEDALFGFIDDEQSTTQVTAWKTSIGGKKPEKVLVLYQQNSHGKCQQLSFFKEVVYKKLFNKVGFQGVLDHLSAPNL